MYVDPMTSNSRVSIERRSLLTSHDVTVQVEHVPLPEGTDVDLVAHQTVAVVHDHRLLWWDWKEGKRSLFYESM